ncbi:MAG: hypothetical protein CMN79_02375 [Spirochaetales bacterium]|nr:hypothetical protein [Spirochaetales bacterium]|tara:strand:+ start:3297 stop:4178 length:882 start_codon:yes stop_codon:yes gene_type:complete
MELWLRVFEVILPVMLVVLTGYLFGRITKVNLKSINLFIMYISTPCLIFASLTEGRVTFNDTSTIVLVGSILVLISILLSFSIIKATKRDLSVYLNPIVFPNTANLGLPIVLFAFGGRAFDYAIMFTTVIFFLQCTIGIFVINGATKIKEVLKSPLVYAVILPILLNKTGIEIDTGINSSIKLLGTTCIPLMMFSLGHKLSETKILDFKEDLAVGALRITLGVVLSLSICKLLNIDNFLAQVMIVQYSMPAAVFNFILADRYNKSPEKVASIVFASTIISIPVIPIILYYLMQ